jgi:hypothetical protein
MKIALLLGGPSMKGIDFDKVKADYFVGVNWSFLISRVQLNVVCDYRCMERIQSDHVVDGGALAIERYNNFVVNQGDNFFVDHAQQRTIYGGSITVKSTYPEWPQYPQLIVDGLYCRNNVGLCGLSAACLLMPNKGEIDIYGLDLNFDSAKKNHDKTVNWHGHHDPSWAAEAKAAYPGMIQAWDEAKKKIPSGIRIRNMNPKSAYKGFEFA